MAIRNPLASSSSAAPAQPSIRFDRTDCGRFARFPERRIWSHVPPDEQEGFRALHQRLRRLAVRAVELLDARGELAPVTSALCPHGRAPAELAGALVPAAVEPGDAPAAVQFALIVDARGAELCLRAGTGGAPGGGRAASLKPGAKPRGGSAGAGRRRAAGARRRAGALGAVGGRESLLELRDETVRALASALGPEWCLRKQWGLPPGTRDFTDLGEWLAFAASEKGGGAAISRNFTAAELEALGPHVLARFVEAARVFRPVFAAAVAPAAARDVVGAAAVELIDVPAPAFALGGGSAGGGAAVTAIGASELAAQRAGESFELAAGVSALVAAIGREGFVFEPWQIAAYVTALRTKPFVILAGATGTGKSRLPALVAAATGAEALVLPVRPDWTDSSDVLGYSDLQGNFRPGPLLRLIRKAAAWPGAHFVCVVDEMNLARVEHYFAEVLSRIEDRRPWDEADALAARRAARPLLTQSLREADAAWAQLELPPNLAIVGTVNMDESAHGFSRKVLDRAFTIELSDVDLLAWEAPPRGAGSSTDASAPLPGGAAAVAAPWPVRAWQPRAVQLSGLGPLAPPEAQLVRRVVAALAEANAFLLPAQLQVGYRTRDEVALFVLHAQDALASFATRRGERVDPLDLALQMKLLPRVAGGSAAVRRVVLGLLGWAAAGEGLASEDDARPLLERWERAGRPGALAGARYPRTAARLCLMWDRMLNEGFTSFWS